MIVEIDGDQIRSEAEFHGALARGLGLPVYYGKNLDALWDVLSTEVERPVLVVWRDASSSQAAMPESFEKIVEVLRKVERQDIAWGFPETERFGFVLS